MTTTSEEGPRIYERVNDDVPLRLQDGKWYVTRKGRHIQVFRRPINECGHDNQYKFVCGNGYITETGRFWADGGVSEYDLVRPVYKEGETYMMRNGGSVTITDDNNRDSEYKLQGLRNYCSGCPMWTVHGKYYNDSSNDGRDLMDYAHGLGVEAGVSIFAEAMPGMNNIIGKRAELIIADDIQETDVNLSTAANIGTRISFEWDGVPSITGVIQHSDGVYFAIELDEGQELPFSPWNCEGRVQSGRGWFVGCNSVTVIPLAAPAADAPSDAAPAVVPARKLLPSGDRKLLWDLYISNASVRSHTLSQLIDLRRELDAACER